MPRILRGKPFSFENVAEMGPASGAADLNTHSIGVRYAFDGPGDFGIEAGPSASGVELRVGRVEGRVTTLAYVGAAFEVMIILPGKGSLGATMDDHSLLGRR